MLSSMVRLGPALALVLLLQACGTPAPPGRPGAGPATGAAPSTGTVPAAPRQNPLESERQWLQSWFAGTPVVIGLGGDGVLAVDVPRDFCFDAGKSTIKAPLAAVLDKVAESLRRQRQARLSLLAAPADAVAQPGLVRQRAMQVRAHLQGRGVPEARLAMPSTAAVAALQLRVELPPAP